jgi:hypothetical protein
LKTSYFLFPLMNFSHKNISSCSFSSPTQPRRKSSPCHRHSPDGGSCNLRHPDFLRAVFHSAGDDWRAVGARALQSLNIFTILGITMLVGLVAKNAILVVDFTNRLKAEGMELKAALLEATHKRFRPIVMTTLAIIAGMLPIALAKGAGAEWKNGLAWVVIGGLTNSLALTLVIVPLVYYLMDKALMRLGWGKKTTVAVEDK